MKTPICIASALAAVFLPLALPAAGLEDLMTNPDDVMLRKPTSRTAPVAKAPKADAEQAAWKAAQEQARAAAEKRAAEAQARAAAEKKAAEEARVAAEKKAAEAQARAEAERKAAEEARAAAEKKAAEAQARAEAERKAAEAQARAVAEKKAAEAQARAEAEKKAAEAQARAEAERKAAEEARAEADRKEAEMKRLREQVAAEQKAREEAEKARKAAESQAAAEKKAAEQAAAEAKKVKTAAEKRAAYLRNPDPDERPAPKKLQAQDEQKDVTETLPSVAVRKPAAEKKPVAKKDKDDKKKTTGRAATVRAGRTDYDRKEGVILFDRNVFVDDEQYQMHADRMFVFLDGTNDLKRLVALGNVAITNENRSAGCARAVFKKAESCIVLFGDEKEPAWLSDAGGKKGDASTVRGTRITYWVDTDMATVDDTVVTVPGFKGGAKDLIGGSMTEGGKKKAE